jgi:WD repeat-containing protein 35
LVALCRLSGVLHVLPLPGLNKETKHKLDATAVHIAINCDSTKAAIVDHHGNLKILSLAAKLVQTEFVIDSKDVWDVCWSRDHPAQFAVTERVQTHTFSGDAHIDVIVNSAQMVDYVNDNIVAVQLDAVLADAAAPPAAALLRFAAAPSLRLISGGDAWFVHQPRRLFCGFSLSEFGKRLIL